MIWGGAVGSGAGAIREEGDRQVCGRSGSGSTRVKQRQVQPVELPEASIEGDELEIGGDGEGGEVGVRPSFRSGTFDGVERLDHDVKSRRFARQLDSVLLEQFAHQLKSGPIGMHVRAQDGLVGEVSQQRQLSDPAKSDITGVVRQPISGTRRVSMGVPGQGQPDVVVEERGGSIFHEFSRSRARSVSPSRSRSAS